MPTIYDFVIFNDSLMSFRDVVMMLIGAFIEGIITTILLYRFKRKI